MSVKEWFLQRVGGALGGAAISALIVGAFIIVAGATPGEWVAAFWTNPPPWVRHWSTPLVLIVAGFVVMIGGLMFNVGQQRKKAVNELADLQSEGIHDIWNRPVANDAELEALEKHDRDWQGRVVAVLKRALPQPECVLFTRLGVIPNRKRDGTYNVRHAKILREYAVREERLRDIIRRHSH
jgi:hypothetical protein